MVFLLLLPFYIAYFSFTVVLLLLLSPVPVARKELKMETGHTAGGLRSLQRDLPAALRQKLFPPSPPTFALLLSGRGAFNQSVLTDLS